MFHYNIVIHSHVPMWFLRTPLDGWVKANSKGLSKGNLGDPACGAIFRDHLGEHLGGFRLFLGHGTTF